MSISAKMIQDSVSPDGIRLISLQLRYPRFIHSEFMTHRVFSRNASSSRAIPIERVIQSIEDDPAFPIHWGKNQSGMQAREELVGADKLDAWAAWVHAARDAVAHARRMAESGAHKQIVNRILEPFAHITVLVTATEWDNWYELRDHEDAQPEIQALAREMLECSNASHPKTLDWHQWHLPYLTPEELTEAHATGPDEWRVNWAAISAARCCRVSYDRLDGSPTTIEADLNRFNLLMGSKPWHASPVEHQACPDVWVPRPHLGGSRSGSWFKPELQGNFRGWRQYRKFIEQGLVDTNMKVTA
jgi:thymidylate synthase ThyX